MSTDNKKIDVWAVSDIANLTPEEADSYVLWLNDMECLRFTQFHFDLHRYQYLMTRATQRAVLTHYYPHIMPQQWRFKKSPRGKPSIDQATDPDTDFHACHFSLSNTDGMILMAVGTEAMIGVDVETIRDQSVIEIAEACFDGLEVAQLRRLTGRAQLQQFYELWTLKESYLKAMGTGLNSSLDSIVFRCPNKDADYSWSVQSGGDMSASNICWRFWKFFSKETHAGAVALGSAEDSTVEIEMHEAGPSLHWRASNVLLSVI